MAVEGFPGEHEADAINFATRLRDILAGKVTPKGFDLPDSY
jgi:hypothetical protein